MSSSQPVAISPESRDGSLLMNTIGYDKEAEKEKNPNNTSELSAA